MATTHFDWIPFYTELAQKLLEYKNRRNELVEFIFAEDAEMKSCVSQIVTASQSYNVRDRNKVIVQNLRPVRHPYYSAYTALQKICLQILRHESIKYGQEKDKVYGVLFDGAWLWEEYLNTILKNLGFNHPENKRQIGGFRMFIKPNEDEQISRNSRKLFPDFYKEDIILDAKYKHLNQGVSREDLYQVVTYMYCQKANHGGYVYPDDGQNCYNNYQLEGYNGFIHLFPVTIPQNKSGYKDFIQAMEESEKGLRSYILNVK